MCCVDHSRRDYGNSVRDSGGGIKWSLDGCRVGRPRECQEQGHVCLEQCVCWSESVSLWWRVGGRKREKTAPGQVNVSRLCFPWPCAFTHVWSADDGAPRGFRERVTTAPPPCQPWSVAVWLMGLEEDDQQPMYFFNLSFLGDFHGQFSR